MNFNTTMSYNSKLLESLQVIIPGGISIDDCGAITGKNYEESTMLLDSLLKLGVGKKIENKYYFEEGDKLTASINLLSSGFQLEEISTFLNWKDFEGLTAKILESKNFATMKNLILTKPRMEIDVVGIRFGIAILIDCKHWQRYSASTLSSAVQKQIIRTRHYVSKTPESMAVPVIVTLFQDKIDFIDKVPIVPISQFSSFIDEFYGNIDELKTIEKEK